MIYKFNDIQYKFMIPFCYYEDIIKNNSRYQFSFYEESCFLVKYYNERSGYQFQNAH